MCWQFVWLSYACLMRSSLWYYFLALRNDDHLPKVGARQWDPVDEVHNLWGTCWLLPICAGFLSLVVGCLWGYEGPNVGVVFFGQKLTYGLRLIGVKRQWVLIPPYCAIAKDSSFGMKSAFKLNWFMQYPGLCVFVRFRVHILPVRYELVALEVVVV